jgi:hypothetical protein
MQSGPSPPPAPPLPAPQPTPRLVHAQAADFAMGQFRFLARLLLVHGRQSYLRCRCGQGALHVVTTLAAQSPSPPKNTHPPTHSPAPTIHPTP